MPHSIELLASTRKKSKETIRVEQLLPEELREKSTNLTDLLRDYYTHINEITQSSYELNSINNQRDIDLADSRIGKISAISVINRGSDYSSSPIVTIVGDGIKSAQVAANVKDGEIIGFTIIDGGLGYTYADVIITDTTGSGATASAVISNARYLDLIQKEIASAIPKNIAANRVNLYKNLIRYYSLRGSGDSIELFFKIIFNDYSEVYYPREDLLIPSSGIWNTGRVPRTYTRAPDVIIKGNGKGATARAVITAGVVSDILPVEVGSGYTGNVSVTIPGGDPDAIAFANVEDGEITSYSIFYGGSGYPMPGQLISNDPEADQGWYSDNKGFLSDTIKLQDSYFYQQFSYVVRTGNSIDTWRDSFNKLVHPAGFIYFPEILIFIEFLATRVKMSKTQPGYIDLTNNLNLSVFEALNGLDVAVPGDAPVEIIMSLDIPVGTSTSELMHYFDGSQVNPYLGLTIQEGDGFSQETPDDPLYPYADYTIDDVINTVITFNDVRLGANLLT